MRIGEIMTKHPVTVVGETLILEAKRIMKENNIRRLPVVDKGKSVDIVGKSEINRHWWEGTYRHRQTA